MGLCLLTSALGAAAPSNDDCLNAFVIPREGPWPFLTPVSALTEATAPASDPKPLCQTNVTRSVWYLFIPARTGYYSLSTCASAPTATTESDTVLGVFKSSNCSGPFTLVACEDDSCGYQASVLAQLETNVRYYIVVWQYKDEATAGVVQLRVDQLSPPANDSCEEARVVELDVPVTGSTVLAANNHQLAGDACFDGIGQIPSMAEGGEVVYRFQALVSDIYSFRAFNYGAGDLVVYVSEICPVKAGVSTVPCLAAANRSQNGTAEEVACLPLSAGQWVYAFVDQASAGVGSSFNFVVTRCRSEDEPNDAPPLDPRSLCDVTGWIPSISDWDFYALGHLADGQRVFALVDGESASLTDFTLRVMAGEDVLEFDDEDNDLVFGNRSPNIAGVPVEQGEIYLAVSFDSVGGFQGSGPYHLYALTQPPSNLATAEQEPNDAPSQATRSLKNYFAGELAGPAPSLDHDFYAFEAAKGDLLFVSLDADPRRDNTPIDARLTLLNSSGQAVLRVDDANGASNTNRTHFLMSATSPRSPGEGLAWWAAEGGTYYVEVSIGEGVGQEAQGAGDYLLSISRNCQPGSRGVVAPAVFGHISRPDNGVIFVSMTGTPGVSYRLERSPDMLTWFQASIASADAQGAVGFTVLQSWGSTFYRAVAP